MDIRVKIYLSQFRSLAIKAAQKQRPAVEWAQMKLDDIPENFHAKIFELANKETWFAEIFGPDPDAPAQIPWLQEMRNAILSFWLLADLTAAAQVRPFPEGAATAYAVGFLDRVSVSFQDTLWNLCDKDRWKEFTAEANIEPVFSECVRSEFEKLLGDDDAPTAPETTRTAAADAEEKKAKRAPAKAARAT